VWGLQEWWRLLSVFQSANGHRGSLPPVKEIAVLTLFSDKARRAQILNLFLPPAKEIVVLTLFPDKARRWFAYDPSCCEILQCQRAHKQLRKSVNESSFLYTVCERTMHGWPQPSSAHVPAVPHVTESWPAAMYIERGRGGRERERRSAGNDNDKKGMTITHTWSANARFSVFTVLSRSCKIPASLAWSWYAFCKPLLPYKRLKSVSLVVSLAYLWV